MIVLFILGILFLLCGVGVGIFVKIADTNVGGILAGVGLAAFGLFLMLVSAFRIVPANTVGVPVTFGSASQPLQSGLHFTGPFTDVKLQRQMVL